MLITLYFKLIGYCMLSSENLQYGSSQWVFFFFFPQPFIQSMVKPAVESLASAIYHVNMLIISSVNTVAAIMSYTVNIAAATCKQLTGGSTKQQG